MTYLKIIFAFILMIFGAFSFITCQMENPVIEEWWQGEEEADIPFIREVFPQVFYEVITEYKYVEIIQQLPPEIIIETVTIEVIREIFIEMIKEVIVEIPVEVIVEIINEVEVEVEVIKEIIKEIEVIREVIVEVPQIVEVIVEIIKEVPVEVIKEVEVTKEIIIEIIKEVPVEVIKEIIVEKELTEQDIINIINQIPPDKIIEYLTIEQIKEIIRQQPPEMILQTLRVVTIEFVLFAGESTEFNGPPGKSPIFGIQGTTDLTNQERATNNNTIRNIAEILASDPEYSLILHGHANPVNATEQEKEELVMISGDRAKSVASEMKKVFTSSPLNGAPDDFDSRVTATGYGGESTIAATTFAGLNRRVEVILIKIDTTRS